MWVVYSLTFIWLVVGLPLLNPNMLVTVFRKSPSLLLWGCSSTLHHGGVDRDADGRTFAVLGNFLAGSENNMGPYGTPKSTA